MLKDLTLQPVASSNIHSVGYDEGSKTLFVRFKRAVVKEDKLYAYQDVPKETFKELVSSPSVGSFFYARVRNNFKFNIVDAS